MKMRSSKDEGISQTFVQKLSEAFTWSFSYALNHMRKLGHCWLMDCECECMWATLVTRSELAGLAGGVDYMRNAQRKSIMPKLSVGS